MATLSPDPTAPTRSDLDDLSAAVVGRVLLPDDPAFVDEVGLPAIGCMADTFHMALEERDIAAAIRLAGPRLAHVHLADSNRAAPGYGHTDFRPIVQAIADVGYDGWISYELLPAAGDVWGVLSGAGAPEFLDPYTEAAISHTKKLESELGPA